MTPTSVGWEVRGKGPPKARVVHDGQREACGVSRYTMGRGVCVRRCMWHALLVHDVLIFLVSRHLDVRQLHTRQLQLAVVHLVLLIRTTRVVIPIALLRRGGDSDSGGRGRRLRRRSIDSHNQASSQHEHRTPSPSPASPQPHPDCSPLPPPPRLVPSGHQHASM
jgi:hypothetical protein